MVLAPVRVHAQEPPAAPDATKPTEPALDAETAAAATLFIDGQAALEAGRLEEACSKLAESQRLHPAAATLLSLALCHERQKKTASAWAEYTEASVLADAEGQRERAQSARDAAGRLAPRLSRLKIDVPAPKAGIVIKRDGVEMRNGFGVALPVDPGAHVVTATAPGHVAFEKKIVLGADSDQQIVIVTLDPIAPPPAPVKPAPLAPKKEPTSPLGVAGFVVGGVGLVGVMMGTAFGIMYLSDSADADDQCAEDVCSPAGESLRDEASTKGTIATIGLSVGVPTLAAGVIMLVVDALSDDATPAPGTQRHVRLVPIVTPDSAGTTLIVPF